jgi:malate synthase
MAAFVPDRNDPERTRTALEQVRKDKQREAGAGYDGSWVAHPGLVSTCREVFDEAIPGAPNQLQRRRDDPGVTAADLLDLTSAPGRPTADGLRHGISVALRYLQAWLGGNGAATVDSLMEDAATVEIIRSQIWQQIHARAALDDGTVVTRERVEELTRAEADRLAAGGLATPLLPDAAELLLDVATRGEFLPFFTCLAYAQHVAHPLAKDQLATRRSAGDPAQPAAAVAAA